MALRNSEDDVESLEVMANRSVPDGVAPAGELRTKELSHPAEYLGVLVQFKESLPPSRGFRRADASNREGSEEPMRLETCPTLDTLAAFLLGELVEPDLSSVAEHLEVFPDCEQAARRLDAAEDEVLAELRRLPHAKPTAEDGATGVFSSGDVSTVPGATVSRPDMAGDEVTTELQQTCQATPTVDAEGSATGIFRFGGVSPMPAPTETWGEFRIVREIGRGGMGVVYEAYQGSLKRHVAVKLLPERGDLARFRREARAAGRLHHTSIVPVFGVGEHQGRPYYVMQYIEGRGLDAVLKERREAGSRLDDREAAALCVQAAEALDHAHRHGVIHRDIKPSNLLVDEQGTVWVTDFGLAHDSSDTLSLTETGDLLGTLRYMAPERLTAGAMRGRTSTDWV